MMKWKHKIDSEVYSRKRVIESLPDTEIESRKEKIKKETPFKYFVYVTIDTIEWSFKSLLMLPSNIRYAFRAAFIENTHIVKTGLSRFEYHETDTVLLHASFEKLVEFVEVEQAWMHHVFEDQRGYPLRKRTRILKFHNPFFDCPEDGIKHLRWSIATIQEQGMEEDFVKHKNKIIELYKWWKFERPNRPNPYNDEKDYYDMNLEIKQYEEDTEKLVELMKIRSGLWT